MGEEKDEGSIVMEQLEPNAEVSTSKRRTRSAKAPESAATPKPRKPRAKKAAPEISVVPSLTPPVAPMNHLDATVPLPPLASNGTSPLTNGGVTAAGVSSSSVPQRIMCQQMEAAFVSDVGRQRSNNEDSASAFVGTVPRPDSGQEMLFGFLAVADGMGGHERGEVASNLAVRKMIEGVLQYFYMPTMEGRQPGRDGETPMDVLRGLIEDANQAILQDGHQHRTSMGTTLTCAVLVGQTAFIGHVGDSRLYVIEKSTGQLHQVTRDHSMVQRLVDLGQLSAEDALNSPQRSILYMSLGQKGRVEADVEVFPLNDVSHMLLCSDGLWDMIEDYEIEHILKTAPGPVEAGATLIAAANKAGGADNITVVVAQF